MLAKASVVRYRHFWGHHAISLASTLRDRLQKSPVTEPSPACTLPLLPYQGGQGGEVEEGGVGVEGPARGGGDAGPTQVAGDGSAKTLRRSNHIRNTPPSIRSLFVPATR